MKDLEGRVALVSGAGSGIGAASAKLLASHGARVGLLGRTESELQEVADAVRQAKGEALVLVADVAKEAEVDQSVRRVFDAWGRLDVVFANAGVNGVWAPITELETDEWRKTLDINLNGTFYTIKFSVPFLKKQGGSVIVCASVNGTRMFSNSGATAYACSKAAQAAMVKMLAVELGQHKIRINVICPGAIGTEIDDNTEQRHIEQARQPVEFPEGAIPLTGEQPGTAAQVAEVVLFLASDRASHVSGTELWVDGGQSLVQG